MRMKRKFTFTGVLEEVRIRFVNAVVFIPKPIILELPKGKHKVNGLINGTPFSMAIQHQKDGNRFFPIGATLRKSANIKPGDTVKLVFTLMETERVDLPEELETTLSSEDKAHQTLRGKTACKKQSLEQYVSVVKNLDSRIRNSIEAVQRARSGKLRPQQQKRKKM